MAKVAFEELKAQVAKVFAANGFNEENARSERIFRGTGIELSIPRLFGA